MSSVCLHLLCTPYELSIMEYEHCLLVLCAPTFTAITFLDIFFITSPAFIKTYVGFEFIIPNERLDISIFIHLYFLTSLQSF